MASWWDSQVYIRSWRLTSPPAFHFNIVHHARGQHEKVYDGEGVHVGWREWTRCGRLISETSFNPYRQSSPFEQFHQRVALRFSRPCKQCYPEKS